MFASAPFFPKFAPKSAENITNFGKGALAAGMESIPFFGGERASRKLHGPMYPTEQPTNPERDQGGGIGLGFDGVAKRALECRRRIARSRHGIARHACNLGRAVACLAVEVLSGSLDLIHHALDLRFSIAEGTADTLLSLAPDVSGCPNNPILVHGALL